MTTRTLSEYAHAAKLIKQELKKEFPKTKFSVVSANGRGSSVTIEWQDGPTEENVNSIIKKYQFDFESFCETFKEALK